MNDIFITRTSAFRLFERNLPSELISGTRTNCCLCVFLASVLEFLAVSAAVMQLFSVVLS